MKVYYDDGSIKIRSMLKEDATILFNTYLSYGWHPAIEAYQNYYNEQETGKRLVFIAEYCGRTAGQCTLVLHSSGGPWAGKGYPEIEDLCVFFDVHKKGIGNKLLDTAESEAAKIADTVYLAVGTHSGYGAAQRIYVKRGYNFDGSGVWYQGRQLEQFAPCVNDDDLVLFMSKKLAVRHVVVQPYDTDWAKDFEAIQAEVSAALGNTALSVEHVGSTSVKGLSAKPIIDLDIVVKNGDVPKAIELLAKIGYIHEGNLGIEGREAFHYNGKEHLRQHHVYVCPENSPELKRHIAFRDYLRSHPEAVREYSCIKEEAAALYPYDIDRYIKHKSPVIEKIYKKAGLV